MALTAKHTQVQAAHTVLGLESSCDETAASVVRRGADGSIEILSSVIASQDEIHRPFGGVVPEIAARAHLDIVDDLTAQAVRDSGLDWDDLDAVAATAGPGLIGGVIAGLMTAKGLALALDKPLIAVNHLEGHALSPALEAPCPFPYLLLLVSGGHTQLLSVNGLGDYTRLGSTVDDAAGEAFDKTAKVMGLGFPGGPRVDAAAKTGNPKAHKLPKPFAGKDHADFSFAGLKTATARAYAAIENPTDQDRSDVAASFQKTVSDVIIDRCKQAMKLFKAKHPHERDYRFVVAGGVAANSEIRASLKAWCEAEGYALNFPPLKFCTDNAAMIALAGAERLAAGDIDDLSAPARPRWPLDDKQAASNPKSGSGRKGPKS